MGELIDRELLMRACIDQDQRIRRYLLSPSQVKVMQIVEKRDRGITARILADNRGISVQNATTQLLRLHRKGYLNRAVITDPTGGVLYWYQSALRRRVRKPY